MALSRSEIYTQPRAASNTRVKPHGRSGHLRLCCRGPRASESTASASSVELCVSLESDSSSFARCALLRNAPGHCRPLETAARLMPRRRSWTPPPHRGRARLRVVTLRAGDSIARTSAADCGNGMQAPHALHARSWQSDAQGSGDGMHLRASDFAPHNFAAASARGPCVGHLSLMLRWRHCLPLPPHEEEHEPHAAQSDMVHVALPTR